MSNPSPVIITVITSSTFFPFRGVPRLIFAQYIGFNSTKQPNPFYFIFVAGDIQFNKMQSILRWSLENSAPLDNAAGDRPPPERKDLDPAIIDYILGKPDSVQMKEDLAVAVDPSKSEDERISALDHLEMVSLLGLLT